MKKILFLLLLAIVCAPVVRADPGDPDPPTPTPIVVDPATPPEEYEPACMPLILGHGNYAWSCYP